jgi:hypothetical protein
MIQGPLGVDLLTPALVLVGAFVASLLVRLASVVGASAARRRTERLIAGLELQSRAHPPRLDAGRAGSAGSDEPI